MDHHIPSAITIGLRRRDVDVVTALDDGTSEFEDPAVLARATELGRPIFTYDDDFLVIAKTLRQQGRIFAGAIYSPERAMSVGKAIHDLEMIAKVLSPQETRNQVIFLPL
jgi:hypothetical protein